MKHCDCRLPVAGDNTSTTPWSLVSDHHGFSGFLSSAVVVSNNVEDCGLRLRHPFKWSPNLQFPPAAAARAVRPSSAPATVSAAQRAQYLHTAVSTEYLHTVDTDTAECCQLAGRSQAVHTAISTHYLQNIYTVSTQVPSLDWAVYLQARILRRPLPPPLSRLHLWSRL